MAARLFHLFYLLVFVQVENTKDQCNFSPSGVSSISGSRKNLMDDDGFTSVRSKS